MESGLGTLIPYYIHMLDAFQLAYGPDEDVNSRLVEIEERIDTREDYFTSLAALYDMEWLRQMLVTVDRCSPIHPDIEMPSVDEIMLEFDRLFK